MADNSTRTHRPSLGRWLPAVIACLCATLVALALGCAMAGTPASVAPPERETLSAADIDSSSANTDAASKEAPPSQSETASPSTLAMQLDPQLKAIADASGMQTCISIIDLQSGERAGYQSDASMVSASMIKLVIAYAFLEQVANGTQSLDGSYVLESSDIVGGTGTLGSLGTGASVSYREIATKMISVSDNTGANILIDAVGMEQINQTAQKLGLTATRLNRRMMDFNGTENYTSADDVAQLLEMAYSGNFVNEESSALVREALEAQQDAGGILSGLPTGITFAHKTGTLDMVRHDGGIVEGEQPFVIVVLCGGNGFYESGALNAMAQVASTTYEVIASKA